MNPILNIAIRAVRQGGNFISQNYDTQRFIHNNADKKKHFIQNILYKTNQIINVIIQKSYPHHIILNKKNYSIIEKKTKIYWIINELNGIRNFSKYFPHFCISIAVVIKGKTEISVIYDPLKNDLFTAVKGQGSQLNGYRIRCSNTNNLESTIVAVNLPDNLRSTNLSYFDIYKKLSECGISFLCTGSTVLDLAYVAAGKIDCLLDFNLNPIDFIAGKLQAREAGCLISDFKGGHENIHFHSANLISNPKFIRLISEKIRSCCL